ncbi:diphthine--ammonia ligase [Halodesulfurarchaeum sp. HSR-GB]|uniref:diphthine--ammonia ligase n=1 Tax=Halodesulfurarchaeum sp. HSR-GB TaxID=3074077 RepID=UPI002855D7BD|nr:diphthine--ammonia ligase [Halodesulfurarchaeum sp. HSR-GB]MDR5656836.1 diphthine--ammonia ligase [Halodesulfurarchaeum sp. HSR-GB]
MEDGQWVSLFSGGKDSVAAFVMAREAGLAVDRLVTVHPEGDSYLYHVPATRLAELAATSIGVELTAVPGGTSTGHDSSERGDEELEPLEETLEALDEEVAGGLAGVTVGAIESEFQATRIADMCRRLGIDMYAPLWRRDPVELGEWFLDRGFTIKIVAVAAAGLDESWLGRTLDREAFAELQALNEQYGVHVLGEGGEFETLVTEGPHMNQPIEIEYTTHWDGTRGHVEIESARLG